MSRLPRLLRTIAPWVGYPFAFLCAFLFFAYLTFPYDRVRDWLVQEVEQPADATGRRHASGLELEIVDLSPSWLTGVDATGVRLVQRPTDPDDHAMEIILDHVHARASLLSLLMGDADLSYEAELAGGTIEGEYADSEGTLHVTADLSGLQLRRIGLLRGTVGIPVTGTASGHVDLTLAEEVSQTAGEIQLTIADLRLGDGHAKLALPGMGDGLTIDEVHAGDLAVTVHATNGLAQIERLSAHGADAELDGSGTLQLLRPMRMSRLDLMLRLHFLDAYKEKSDRTRALFSLLELNPAMRPARTSDGALQYRVTGSLGSRISATAAGRAPAPGMRARAPGANTPTPMR